MRATVERAVEVRFCGPTQCSDVIDESVDDVTAGVSIAGVPRVGADEESLRPVRLAGDWLVGEVLCTVV